jgi:hypothetical protein
VSDAYTPLALPSVPTETPQSLRNFLYTIKESLEVRLNQRGNALDSAPTFRDLVACGLMQLADGITIGGNTYTRNELLGLVSTTIPDWITSDTAPPAPIGLVVGSDKTNTVLSWQKSAFDQYGFTEIWRATSNDLSQAQRIGWVSGTGFTDGIPLNGESWYYWIRDVALNPTLIGPFNDVNGATISTGPGAVVVQSAFNGVNVELWWPTPTSNLAVQLYRIEYSAGGVWVELDIVGGNNYSFPAAWAGTREFRIQAIDIGDALGPFSGFVVTVVMPDAPPVAQAFDGEQLVLNWSKPTGGSLPIDRYEVFDNNVNPANLVSAQYSTAWRTKVTWLSRTIYVRAMDSAGNAGEAHAVVVSVAPGQVVGLDIEVIDNNVLLRWGNTPGSLPILSFELRRGLAWAVADVIGRKDGGFTTVFEAPQAITTYTYWLAAIDTAGNYGTPVSVTGSVAQPPDYTLAANYVSAFAGTKNNALLEDGGLTLPINTTETWAQHFDTRGWASPQAQIDAGYPIYGQPGVLTAWYEEVWDYGTTLAAMKITATWLLSVIAGSVSAAIVITVAQDAAFTVGVQTFTAAGAYAVNFRYIKIRITITGGDDKAIARLTNLRVVLDAKLKSFTGMFYANASDSGGTTVYLTDNKTTTGSKVFVDVDSINITASGTTPIQAVYDFADVPNPLGFKALLYNSAGARISGVFSATVRGY